MPQPPLWWRGNFYPRPPRGGRRRVCLCKASPGNFYPRPPRGGRPSGRERHPSAFADFYPRPPRGGRLSLVRKLVKGAEFLSTPSAGRATQIEDLIEPEAVISIHALRGEGDTLAEFRARVERTISIHALRGEGDDSAGIRAGGVCYFYPRPPRGGRPQKAPVWRFAYSISIHALRGEGDLRMDWKGGGKPVFLSTPSAGRATSTRQSFV